MRKLINAINWEVAFPAIYVLACLAFGRTLYALGHAQANADTAARVQRQSTPEAVEAARRLHELANTMRVYPFERRK
ncbi:MAG: hypothetical protein ACOZEN_10625 [Thermodesulfobacteriota bacterium]